jgi:hypothetical protein
VSFFGPSITIRQFRSTSSTRPSRAPLSLDGVSGAGSRVQGCSRCGGTSRRRGSGRSCTGRPKLVSRHPRVWGCRHGLRATGFPSADPVREHRRGWEWWKSAGATCTRPRAGVHPVSHGPPQQPVSRSRGGRIICEGGSQSGAAPSQAPAPVGARHSTSVIVMVIGAPTAPRGRIIRRRWVVSWGRWVVPIVAVRGVVRIIVGL